jgi:hypothetical protein
MSSADFNVTPTKSRDHRDWSSGVFTQIRGSEVATMRAYSTMRTYLMLFATTFAIATAPLAAQSAAKPSAPASWSVPRMPDGKPDLQGTWTNAANQPLERPKDLGAKEFYTPEELAAVNKKGYLGQQASTPEAHYDFAQYGMYGMQAKFAPNLRTSLIVGPEGRVPAMTPEGAQRNAARAAALKGHEFDGPENRNLLERCIVFGDQEGPPMIPPMYNNNMEIVQSPGMVAIFNEMFHDVRLIPTDGRRSHPDASVRLWRGDSIGRWEGDTLVVDTTNFSGKAPFHGSSEYMHVVERFTRTDPNTILYQFTLEDPHTWTKPFSGELVMGPSDGGVYEFACHEGNRGLPNNLRGARLAEEQAAKNAK